MGVGDGVGVGVGVGVGEGDGVGVGVGVGVGTAFDDPLVGLETTTQLDEPSGILAIAAPPSVTV